MLKRMRSFLVLVMLFIAVTMSAQVTTATMSGKVTAQDEPIIGATVVAVHEPSGTRYGTVTNVSGQFNLQGMRTGGPYKVEVSYVGYQTAIYKGINQSFIRRELCFKCFFKREFRTVGRSSSDCF